jgi:thiamine kinase-like enzyme
MPAMTDPLARAGGLPCWKGTVTPRPLKGGITNANFVVEDGGERFVVRIGDDIPLHGVMRFNELAASRAAYAAGLSPEVVFQAPGVLVMRFIDGHALTPEEVRRRAMLGRILPLIKRCHREMPHHFRGPVLAFWVFQVLRDYAARLAEEGTRRAADLPRLRQAAARLEAMVGPIELVFGHNDLLAGNLIDDGSRLWLIDWDYAGLNSPLFDLGNLCSNNEVEPADEAWLLEQYFERKVDDALFRRYAAMKAASLLRETLWSMVSEHHSTLDFDYAAYTDDYLGRFERAYRHLSDEAA